jgi:uncharacterized protein (TIGR02145 family)
MKKIVFLILALFCTAGLFAQNKTKHLQNGKIKIIYNNGTWSDQPETGKFTDSRDGKVYKTITIGTQTWMAENLAYTGNNGVQRHITNNDAWANNTKHNGWCYYGNNSSNGNKYGVLYQWEAAKHACPADWHLPSDAEWKTLERNLGMTATEANESGYRGEGIGTKLKSTTGWELYEGKNYGNNESGFSALPGGDRNYNDGAFNDAGKYSGWWTNTPYGSKGAWRRSLDYGGKVYRYGSYRKRGFSVRCVRD